MCSSGLQPPLLLYARLPRGETGRALRSVCDGARPRAPASFLPLRELEPLAGRGLPVLLPLLHPRIARQEPFLAERPAKRGIDPQQRARDSEADRPRLTRRASPANVGDE